MTEVFQKYDAFTLALERTKMVTVTRLDAGRWRLEPTDGFELDARGMETLREFLQHVMADPNADTAEPLYRFDFEGESHG